MLVNILWHEDLSVVFVATLAVGYREILEKNGVETSLKV